MIQYGAYNRTRWAIVLAGGDGVRLRSLTLKLTGRPIPKQFCVLVGSQTMLEQTCRRVAIAIDPNRTLFVVTRCHEDLYEPLLSGLPDFNLVVQPQNRGTAPAILYALLRLGRVSTDDFVAIFPSDHYVSDQCRFMRSVDAAFNIAEARPELTVVLGIPATYAETSYGWIEPGQPAAARGANGRFFSIRRFWEKPDSETAQRFMKRGYLWNSFVLVGRVSTLIRLFVDCTPELHGEFQRVRKILGTMFESEAIERLYRDLPSLSFSDKILSRCPPSLATIAVPGIEWSDLGQPERVMAVLGRAAPKTRLPLSS
jgi:mannose-1-phosphate guanylyltransferase